MFPVKIYKNQLDENKRIKYLDILKKIPPELWFQSDCTDEEVLQLKEFMPFVIKEDILTMHLNMIDVIEKDFNLLAQGKRLMHYAQKGDLQFILVGIRNVINIDKRVKGNSLSPHADVPTGTYEKEKGVFFKDGTSPITISSIFYWNDDFDGGELNFYFNIDSKDLSSNSNIHDFDKILPDYTYKPVAGDFVVFPSNIVHSINTVNSGERYSTQYFYLRYGEY